MQNREKGHDSQRHTQHKIMFTEPFSLYNCVKQIDIEITNHVISNEHTIIIEEKNVAFKISHLVNPLYDTRDSK